MNRQVPKPRDFAELLRFQRPALRATERRLRRAHTIADLREIAKRVTPKASLDYTDGAAEAEQSLARARQAFQDIEFHPAILRDVSDVDTSCTITGGARSLSRGLSDFRCNRVWVGHWLVGNSRSSNMMAKALSAGFQRTDHRCLPRPVGQGI